jgi:hypothetical protein
VHVRKHASNLPPCPIDCVLGNFGTWSACSGCTKVAPLIEDGFVKPSAVQGDGWKAQKQTQVGVQSRFRQVLIQPQHGGTPCGTTADVAAAFTAAVTDADAAEFAASLTNADGSAGRRRLVTPASSMHTGTVRMQPHKRLRQERQCICALDCVVSVWGSCAACLPLPGQHAPATHRSCDSGSHKKEVAATKAAADGLQRCARNITKQPLFGGKSCPTLTSLRHCVVPPPSLPPCPRAAGGLLSSMFSQPAALVKKDCEVSAWSCSLCCPPKQGGSAGSRVCTRRIVQDVAYGGEPCPALLRATVEQHHDHSLTPNLLINSLTPNAHSLCRSRAYHPPSEMA